MDIFYIAVIFLMLIIIFFRIKSYYKNTLSKYEKIKFYSELFFSIIIIILSIFKIVTKNTVTLGFLSICVIGNLVTLYLDNKIKQEKGN